MAVLHYCYSFTSDVLKKDLAGTPDEVIARLHQKSAEACRKPSHVMAEALEAVRFSPSWLTDEEESDRPAKQLLVCLLGHCHPALSLGRSGELPYHLILKALLTDAGWSNERITDLIRGKPATILFSMAERKDLEAIFTGLTDIVGILGPDECAKLTTELNSARDYFFIDHARHEEVLGGIVPNWSGQGAVLAKSAWSRAVDMLSSRASERDALILILD